jgi:hypothetical protein
VSTRRFVILTGLLFTALTAVMTFPQVLHMRDAVHDDGDPLLVTWSLAWVAHQLPRAPAHLFDANIFYPERGTFAFSETLVAPGLVVAPLHWIGVEPILVYNLVLLSGFVLSGVATAALVRSLTGDGGAAVVAGLIFAFLPYRIDQYAHLQLQQTAWLPLALWAFHALLRSGRVRDGILLGLCVAAQALSCVYYGLFLVPYMVVVWGAILIAHPALWRPCLRGLAVATATALLAGAPVALAYMTARERVGERVFQDNADLSAAWWNYLAAPAANLLYGNLTAPYWQPERALFPGLTAITLALVALWPRRPEDTKTTITQERVVPRWFRGYSKTPAFAYALGLLLAFDVSLGTNGVTYRLLYDYFLPFRALRAPARMGMIVGLSIAVLAGLGVAHVTARLGSARTRRRVVVAIAICVLIEYASRPVPLQPIPHGVPDVYADLIRDRGDNPDVAVVEYPLGEHNDPTYMYYSTFHWQHLANGYSGFFPASYQDLLFAVESFPGDKAIDAFRARSVRYLVLHGERMVVDRYDRMRRQLDARPDLRLISRRPGERFKQHGEISLYRVVY